MYTYMYICLQAHAYQDMNVEIRRQLAGGSFPLQCESQRLDSGRQLGSKYLYLPNHLVKHLFNEQDISGTRPGTRNKAIAPRNSWHFCTDKAGGG